LTALADLAGLGPTEGPEILWTVPKDFPRGLAGALRPTMPTPPAPRSQQTASWLALAWILIFAGLYLALRRTGR
jgi:hypothetical protein